MFNGKKRKLIRNLVMISVNIMLLTDFLIVIGQPSSSTGPLSVSLILNRSEKLIGRM